MLYNKEIIAVLLVILANNGVSGLLGCAIGCGVGVNVTGLDNACDKGDSGCKDGCGGLFGSGLCGSSCISRENGKKECICDLDCAIAGEWGDPHYWTFDMFQFGFQGLCKHTVLKQCKKAKSFPNFEVRYTNAPWIPGSPTSGVSKVEVIVSDWNQTIEVTADEHITVNGKAGTFPYTYSTTTNNGAKNYIRVKTNPIEQAIETSFGLTILLQKLASYDVYMWTFVMIPAHPDLKGNTCGMFGSWDDNPTNDIKDPEGKQSVADPAFSWIYGQSWCVTGEGAITIDPAGQAERAAKLAANLKVCDASVAGAAEAVSNPLAAASKAQKGAESRVRSSCKKLLNPSFKGCNFALWAAASLESCVMDMCSFKEEKDQDQYICTMLKTMNRFCKTNVETC